jgi:arginase
MKLALCLLAAFLPAGPAAVMAQSAATMKTKVTIVRNAYTGNRGEPELSGGPDALEKGGLIELLNRAGCALTPSRSARLTPKEDKQYGAWNRMGLANAHLGAIVSESLNAGSFPIGLLGNCNSLLGMLAGVQKPAQAGHSNRIGLVWIDAHADFNTPETTLSGMLGGMPVATAAGLCLARLRLQSGLDPALPSQNIAMVAVRDMDPLEKDLVSKHRIALVPASEVRAPFLKIHEQMKRLSGLTDRIYVHIDMDVLDPAEVTGHPLTVAGGPGSQDLAAALTVMFGYEKAVALGIASYPWERDAGRISLKAAYSLIEGALQGLRRPGRR